MQLILTLFLVSSNLVKIINSNNLFVDYFMFSVYTSSSANNNSLVSFFMILISFIYFSCLTLLARTSGTMMNRSGDSGAS